MAMNQTVRITATTAGTAQKVLSSGLEILQGLVLTSPNDSGDPTTLRLAISKTQPASNDDACFLATIPDGETLGSNHIPDLPPGFHLFAWASEAITVCASAL